MALAIGLLENMATSEISATTFRRVCTSTGADPDSEVQKRLAACEACIREAFSRRWPLVPCPSSREVEEKFSRCKPRTITGLGVVSKSGYRVDA